MLLFTEPHFDLNAGLVISVGTSYPPDYDTHNRNAEEWEQRLLDSRKKYLASTAAPPNPTAAALSGLVYTPLLGTVPKTALDLTHAWALLGLFCIDRYWPIPAVKHTESSSQTVAASSSEPVQWPRHASSTHLTTRGCNRQPSLTRWARCTFEQGTLSLLPNLQGIAVAKVMPGHLCFQANRIHMTHMRPAILHSYGSSKADAPEKLALLAQAGSLSAHRFVGLSCLEVPNPLFFMKCLVYLRLAFD
eukprot:Skav227342  [mRNA]  locus=scaffold1665:30545:31285:+ [translate_table: standard]